jgi:viologen exporter family transport system permease protein
MTGLAGVYAQQFRITLASFLQYRASIFIWMIGSILEPVIYLVVWSVVARTRGGAVGGFGVADFAAYFIVMMLVNHFTYTWIFYEFEYRIRQGTLSMALLRPLHPIHSDLVDNLTSKLISMPLLAGTALLLALAFHPAWHPAPWALAAAVPALLLAFALRFLIEWTLALAAFWTVRVSAVNQGYFVVLLFLSGQVAPLSLLPGPLQTAAALLPFRWMLAFPVELLLGRVAPQQALTGLGMLLGWLVAAPVGMRIAWRAGVRVYSAVGA